MALILLQQILIILFAYIIIRNPQNEPGTISTDNRQHTVIEQQTGKYLFVSKHLCRKSSKQVRYYLSLFSYLEQDTFTVLIQLIQTDKFLHLTVVSTGIRVNHHFR